MRAVFRVVLVDFAILLGYGPSDYFLTAQFAQDYYNGVGFYSNVLRGRHRGFQNLSEQSCVQDTFGHARTSGRRSSAAHGAYNGTDCVVVYTDEVAGVYSDANFDYIDFKV